MSHTRRSNAEGRTENLTNTDITASGTRNNQSTEVTLNKIDHAAVADSDETHGSQDFEKEPRYQGILETLAQTLDLVEALYDQRASRATASGSSTLLQTSEESLRASLRAKRELIRRHCDEKGRILVTSIAQLEEDYKRDMELLDKEESEVDSCPVGEWREDEPDYAPTECGD